MTNLTRFSSASRGVYQGLSCKFRLEYGLFYHATDNTVNQNTTEKPERLHWPLSIAWYDIGMQHFLNIPLLSGDSQNITWKTKRCITDRDMPSRQGSRPSEKSANIESSQFRHHFKLNPSFSIFRLGKIPDNYRSYRPPGTTVYELYAL